MLRPQLLTNRLDRRGREASWACSTCSVTLFGPRIIHSTISRLSRVTSKAESLVRLVGEGMYLQMLQRNRFAAIVSCGSRGADLDMLRPVGRIRFLYAVGPPPSLRSAWSALRLGACNVGTVSPLRALAKLLVSKPLVKAICGRSCIDRATWILASATCR
jgi:hypothetical protein